MLMHIQHVLYSSGNADYMWSNDASMNVHANVIDLNGGQQNSSMSARLALVTAQCMHGRGHCQYGVKDGDHQRAHGSPGDTFHCR